MNTHDNELLASAQYQHLEECRECYAQIYTKVLQKLFTTNRSKGISMYMKDSKWYWVIPDEIIQQLKGSTNGKDDKVLRIINQPEPVKQDGNEGE